ncbi:sensor domain-containing diguanylate cyclase [Sulfuricurvum sp.]|uniref:sensor domain-containing diguanylate cyclase n=1 Tax=Sulfuricurvum sp. TaxID=2025608 RepID=UPI0026262946|nr:sensor domain-containing diguanylate cyclase [Sulfuricurvum sp.]MDD3598180.1 diguanylate cyclase [Sulfuricurvum sp.]
MNKANKVELYIKIALFLLFISSLIVFHERKKAQLNEIYTNAENIKTALESNIQGGIEAVKYLNTSAQLIVDNKENIPLKSTYLIKEYNDKGNYTADSVFDKNVVYEDKANISGYGGLKKDDATLREMEMSLSLIRYFKLIKEQNKDFAWVYYYSNKDFITLYPFVESKDFALLPEYKTKPLMTYATPKLNPDKELFFTPLYIDNGGLGLMVTIGMPLYDKEVFLGATELDITLESQSEMLKRLDHLDHHSAIINKENEVIGINNIVKPNTKEIIKIDSVLSNIVLNMPDSKGSLSFIDGKYVYSKTFANAPWKLIYYEDAFEIMLGSFFYVIPLIIIMAFLFYLGKLYSRTHQLSIELKEQATRDYMTGCYNRRYFYEVAEPIFFKNKRKNAPLAVVMMDIDNFKKINDMYGHDIGDRAIQEIPVILGKNLRKSDLLARFGGEEFCMILEDITLENTQKVFERVRENFENNRINVNGVEIRYTVSFGVAYGLTDSLEEMINLSDKALYDSKNNGRNRVTIKNCR